MSSLQNPYRCLVDAQDSHIHPPANKRSDSNLPPAWMLFGFKNEAAYERVRKRLVRRRLMGLGRYPREEEGLPPWQHWEVNMWAV